jgi:hypothetical protein
MSDLSPGTPLGATRTDSTTGSRARRSSAAEQRWNELNERQRTYLATFYRLDQETEARAKAAWGRGEQTRPASEWRWLDYGWVGHPDTGPGELQQRLRSRGVRDQGAGSTLKVLEQRGLIATRAIEHSVFYPSAFRMQVQLTKAGRAACRAGGLDPDRPIGRRAGMLSETMWRMLVDVVEAEPDGLPVRYTGGAWTRLTDREPDPFVAVDTQGARHGERMRLTDAGRAHFRDRWFDYVRAYPAVDAPHPDGEQVWPDDVDEHLKYLRQVCVRLHDEMAAARTAPEALQQAAALPAVPLPGVDPVEVTGLPPAAADAVRRRNRAAATCATAAHRATERHRTALQKATTTYRAALDAYRLALEEPYRQACVHYAAAAATAVQAAADGADPRMAVRSDPPAPGSWPWAPAVPATGLAEVDAQLTSAYDAATARPRRRRRAAAPIEPDLLTDGRRLTSYADTMAALVEGGRLVRLLLRR